MPVQVIYITASRITHRGAEHASRMPRSKVRGKIINQLGGLVKHLEGARVAQPSTARSRHQNPTPEIQQPSQQAQVDLHVRKDLKPLLINIRAASASPNTSRYRVSGSPITSNLIHGVANTSRAS